MASPEEPKYSKWMMKRRVTEVQGMGGSDSSTDAGVVSTKDQRGSPVDCHIKAIPPTHDTSQVC